LSPWGYMLFTAWATSLTLVARDRGLASIILAELTFGLIWSRRGMRLLRRPRFWVFVLSVAALGPFLIGQPDARWGWLRFSRDGLAAGLEMAGRAAALTLAIGLGMGSLSLSDVVALFDRVGLRGMGFATALAMNLLDTLRETAAVTLQTIWLRGGMRRPWTALRLFLITTIANTLRYGDEVVGAASLRAFDPDGGPRARVPLRRADLWILALLAGPTGLLLATGIR
jgi:energy-coupling factor transporter transmembrane protein EcfT